MTACPNPPYFPNGSWCGWMTQFNNVSATTDPVSVTFGTGLHAIPILMPIFLGALYVFLWVRFGRAPSVYKFIGISGLMLVISIVMAAGGLVLSAVLNFGVFAAAYFLSYLYNRSRE